jgi:ABC-type lipoprotein export system ATPase subunit
VIAAQRVSFGYPGAAPLLHEWSVTFEDGTISAVTGPSGRGKSTLLYLLGLMLRPSAGQVEIDGQPVSGLSDRRRASCRAESFGFVFQDAALDPSRTVMDNVIEGAVYRQEPRPAARRRASRLLDEFGVALRADARPGQVSGGQAQRIALCRALLADPAIILADEPTGNLDPASATVVFDALHQRAQAGATVVIVTHDEGIAARCDRQVEL